MTPSSIVLITLKPVNSFAFFCKLLLLLLLCDKRWRLCWLECAVELNPPLYLKLAKCAPASVSANCPPSGYSDDDLDFSWCFSKCLASRGRTGCDEDTMSREMSKEHRGISKIKAKMAANRYETITLPKTEYIIIRNPE